MTSRGGFELVWESDDAERGIPASENRLSANDVLRQIPASVPGDSSYKERKVCCGHLGRILLEALGPPFWWWGVRGCLPTVSFKLQSKLRRSDPSGDYVMKLPGQEQ